MPHSATDITFVIQRQLQAPRQLVWDVYTQTAHLQHWFGPKGVTMSHGAMDFRVGKTFHYSQAVEGGGSLWGMWNFREIVAPEKIVLVQHFSDADGGVTRNPWNPGWPLRTLSTTTFAEHDGGTLLTIQWAPLDASDDVRATFLAGHAGMSQGWGSVLDGLVDYLALLQTP